MIDLEAAFLDAQIAVHLATANLDAAVARSWSLSDDDALTLIDPFADAVAQAERTVAAIKDRINYLTPSSYMRNYR